MPPGKPCAGVVWKHRVADCPDFVCEERLGRSSPTRVSGSDVSKMSGVTECHLMRLGCSGNKREHGDQRSDWVPIRARCTAISNSPDLWLGLPCTTNFAVAHWLSLQTPRAAEAVRLVFFLLESLLLSFETTVSVDSVLFQYAVHTIATREIGSLPTGA